MKRLLSRIRGFLVPSREEVWLGEQALQKSISRWMSMVVPNEESPCPLACIVGDYGMGKSHWLSLLFKRLAAHCSRSDHLFPIYVSRADRLALGGAAGYRSLFDRERGLNEEFFKQCQKKVKAGKGVDSSSLLEKACTSKFRNPHLYHYVAGVPGGPDREKKAEGAGLPPELPLDDEDGLRRIREVIRLASARWERGVCLLIDEVDIVPEQGLVSFCETIDAVLEERTAVVLALSSQALLRLEGWLEGNYPQAARFLIQGFGEAPEIRSFFESAFDGEGLPIERDALDLLVERFVDSADRTWGSLGQQVRSLIRRCQDLGQTRVTSELVKPPE